MLIGCWLAAELIPLVPSLDLQQFKDSLKPLFMAPRFSAGKALLAGASVLLLAEALGQLVGLRRASHGLPVLLLLAASLKVFVVTVYLDVSMVVGWTGGALLWIVLATGRVRDRQGTLVLVTLIALMVAAFEPFRLASPPNRMNLLPFGSLLDGHMLSNARVLLGKFFIFAGLMWIACSRVRSKLPVTIGLVGLILTLELMQILVDGRIASIDEPLLVLLAAIVVFQWERLTGEVTRSHQARHSAVSLKASAHPSDSVRGFRRRELPRASHFRSTIFAVLVLGCLIFLALRIPGVPYNVRELLDGDGGIFYASIFGLAILWIGSGGYWVGQVAARRDFPIVVFPAASFLAGIVSLVLLSASVTNESVDDIAGSTNLYWFVTNKEIWGYAGKQLFLLLGSGLVSFLERVVRYAALYGPIVAVLGFLVALRLRFIRASLDRNWLLAAVMGTTGGLLFCKLVAFDWSSTDNLNELVAPPGQFGLGGGGFLYLLVVLVAMNSLLLLIMSNERRRLILALGLSLVALPLSWFLLQLGLHPAVEKYGITFSGVQFLLGPDRRSALTDYDLFGRWAVVYFFAVVTIAIGLRLGQGLFSGKAPTVSPAN
jgi:hypothetical protein